MDKIVHKFQYQRMKLIKRNADIYAAITSLRKQTRRETPDGPKDLIIIAGTYTH